MNGLKQWEKGNTTCCGLECLPDLTQIDEILKEGDLAENLFKTTKSSLK
jgi:hypothetical protein